VLTCRGEEEWAGMGRGERGKGEAGGPGCRSIDARGDIRGPYMRNGGRASTARRGWALQRTRAQRRQNQSSECPATGAVSWGGPLCEPCNWGTSLWARAVHQGSTCEQPILAADCVVCSRQGMIGVQYTVLCSGGVSHARRSSDDRVLICRLSLLCAS